MIDILNQKYLSYFLLSHFSFNFTTFNKSSINIMVPRKTLHFSYDTGSKHFQQNKSDRSPTLSPENFSEKRAGLESPENRRVTTTTS